MKFHNYLEQVIGNKITIRLLRVMIKYKGKIFTMRNLAVTANVSTNETALRIHDLEKFGMINIQPVGRAYQLSFNEDNYVLNKIIKPALDAEKNTLNELLRILRKHFGAKKKIIAVALFGSICTQEEENDSDIDLLLISNDFEYATASVADAIEKVSNVFHNNLSHIIFSKKELKSKKNNSLIKSIISNHIMICGKDLASVIK